MSVSHLEAEQSEDCPHKDGQDDDVSQVLDGVNDGVDDGLEARNDCHGFQGSEHSKDSKCRKTTLKTFLHFLKKWTIPGLFFFIFVFSMQLTVNNVQ